MIKWKKQKLCDLCSRIGDGLHGTPTYSDNSDIYFINGNNLKDGKIVIDSETKTVNKEELDKNYVELNHNSLLLSINGTLGSMAFYNGEKVMLGKSSAYLNFKTSINKYYYYYFQLKNIQKYFYDVATGSTIKNLSLKSLQDFEVPLPAEIEWKKISSILSALDDKIELNNKINAELEAMAKTIYDYWFVQFDFPDKNGKPYKSSGGKMVYNEILKREMPEGWEVKSLENMAIVEKGELITEKIAIPGNIKVIAGGVSFSYTHNDYNRISNVITVSGSGANAGLVNYWRENIFASDCTTVKAKSNAMTFIIYQHLKDIQHSIYQQAKGSAQPHVYPSDIKCINYYNIPDEILTKVENILNGINDKIAINLKQNQELSNLRDWLLPMLMNGQVSVGKAYREVEEVMSMAAEEEVKYKT